MKISKELAASIIALKQDPNWQRFVGAVSDYGEETVKSMIAGNPSALPSMQGRAQAITRILDTILQAESVLDKFKNQS